MAARTGAATAHAVAARASAGREPHREAAAGLQGRRLPLSARGQPVRPTGGRRAACAPVVILRRGGLLRWRPLLLLAAAFFASAAFFAAAAFFTAAAFLAAATFFAVAASSVVARRVVVVGVVGRRWCAGVVVPASWSPCVAAGASRTPAW